MTSASWLVPAQAGSDGQDQAVVAEMGGVRLTRAQFRTILSLLNDETRNRLSASPALLDQLARDEVLNLYLLREAKDHGIDRKPAVIAKMEHAAVQALVAAYLAETAALPADQPSAQQVRSYYEQNKQQFRRLPQLHLQQIFLEITDKDDKTAQDHAAERIHELQKTLKKNPESFAALARSNSQHVPSADKGGDLGWVDTEALMPGLAPALASMKPGQISPPIHSDQGWHIIRLVERRPGPQMAFETVKSAITAALRQRLSQQLRQSTIDQLRERIPPMIHHEAMP